MVGIGMSDQPGRHMAALLFDLIQNIGTVFLPAAVHYNEPAGSVFNDHCQLLSFGVMVCQHGQPPCSKIGGRIRHRGGNRTKGCRHRRAALYGLIRTAFCLGAADYDL